MRRFTTPRAFLRVMAAAMLAATTLSVVTPAAAAGTVFVDQTAIFGGNDGSSWSDAFLLLEDGLAEAAATGATEVQIATGTYLRPASGPFVVPEGVTITGGYAPGGFQGPDPVSFITTLTSDVDGNDVLFLGGPTPTYDIFSGSSLDLELETWRTDNRGQVVEAERTSIVDGVVITGGRFGGGIEMGNNTLLRNSTVRWNTNRPDQGGGGVWVPGDPSPLSTVVIDNSIIEENINGDGNSGVANTYTPEPDGGGVWSREHLVIRNSTIQRNLAWLERGGGVALAAQPFGVGNNPSLFASPSLTIENTVFDDNRATLGGGAIYIGETDTDFYDEGDAFDPDVCTGGSSTLVGLGTPDTGAIVAISDSAFVDNNARWFPLGPNSSDRGGGGVLFHCSTRMNVLDSVFDGNEAQRGGAIAAYGWSNEQLYFDPTLGGPQGESYLTIDGATFSNNMATAVAEGGDAVFVQSVSDVDISNSVFSDNGNADQNGDVFFGFETFVTDNFTMDVDITNVTMSNLTVNNSGTCQPIGVQGTAPVFAGGVTLWDVDVVNSIVWDDACSDLVSFPFSFVEYEHSIVRSFAAALDPTVEDIDPIFVSSSDLRLDNASPAINAADHPSLVADAFDRDGDSNTTEAAPNADLTERIVDTFADLGAYEAGVRDGMTYVALTEPCRVFNSGAATGSNGGAFAGGETRTIPTIGTLPTDQGASATSCVPDSNVGAVVYTIMAADPQAGGNLRLSPEGVVPNGGVVNYAANGLNNTNTVTIPAGSTNSVDITANVGATDVRLWAVGYYLEPDAAVSGTRYTPITPCAVGDTRSTQGAGVGFVGPHIPGTSLTFDVVGSFAAGQGGGNTDCGVPATASTVVLNLVSTNPSGSAAAWRAATGGDVPVAPAVATAPLSTTMNNAVVVAVPLSGGDSVTVDLTGPGDHTSNVRLVALGYYAQTGDDFFPVTPCAAFDTRSNQGAAAPFEGTKAGGTTTTFQITGFLDPDQGGDNGGTCGVPDDATSVLLNLVAINPQSEGNLRVSAAGTIATGGVLNFAALSPAMNNANAVIVPLSALGHVDVAVNTGPTNTAGTSIRGVVLGYFR